MTPVHSVADIADLPKNSIVISYEVGAEPDIFRAGRDSSSALRWIDVNYREVLSDDGLIELLDRYRAPAFIAFDPRLFEDRPAPLPTEAVVILGEN